MSFIELFLIAVSLAMDAFAVSVSNGLILPNVKKRDAVTFGLYFGLFQFFMPVIGYFLGSKLTKYVQQFDHWIAFILLGIIGFNMIKESFGEEKVIVLSNNDNFQCILKRTKEKTITKEYFEKIQKNISEKTGYTAAIGVSRVENSYQRFGKAYQDARDAVEIAVCQEFNSKVLCIEDAGFWRIMKEISKHEMCQEFMEDKLNAFIEYDQKNESELLETLEVLVNNLGARNVTANALHLHRNTLIYRIKKIENQTGYDLSDPNSILEIALALRIKKFLK